MTHTRRQLSSKEEQILLAMIDSAGVIEGSAQPTAADRQKWRAQVPDLVVDEVCDCGHCPSISLFFGSAPSPSNNAEQVVLTADLPDALILVFIDHGVPRYVELAPRDDQRIYAEFPAPDVLLL